MVKPQHLPQNSSATEPPQAKAEGTDPVESTAGSAVSSKNKLPRRFECSLCPRSCTEREHRNRHLHNLRGSTRQRSYECKASGCDKCYGRRTDLVRHARVHQKAGVVLSGTSTATSPEGSRALSDSENKSSARREEIGGESRGESFAAPLKPQHRRWA